MDFHVLFLGVRLVCHVHRSSNLKKTTTYLISGYAYIIQDSPNIFIHIRVSCPNTHARGHHTDHWTGPQNMTRGRLKCPAGKILGESRHLWSVQYSRRDITCEYIRKWFTCCLLLKKHMILNVRHNHLNKVKLQCYHNYYLLRFFLVLYPRNPACSFVAA